MQKILFILLFFATLGVLHGQDISKVIKEAQSILKTQGSLAAGKYYIKVASEPKVNLSDTRKLLNLAASHLISNNLDLAFQCVRRALVTPCNNNVENQRTYVLLGRCYAKAQLFNQAIGACKNIALAPNSSHPSLLYSAWLCIGTSHLELREYKEARNAFKEAIAAGKKVPYRFNYQQAEKLLERIKNK